jgi:prolyl-tRNA editing enzyme YbaK/EbsC (Cys-tRNA(Pro) deacylase)
MRGALDVHRELLSRGVPHEVVRLPSRVASADELPAALGLDSGCLAVRVYVVTRPGASTATAAVLVPAGAVPDPGSLLEALQATSVRPASCGEVNLLTGFADGLVSPVCLPPEVEVLADAAVGAHDVVYTTVGEGGLALGIGTRDLLVAAAARAASLTPTPLPPDQRRYADVVELHRHPPGHTARRPGP